jgi:hypothetical protein
MDMDSSKYYENFIYIAKLSRKVEWYNEMMKTMKKVPKLDVELTIKKR